MKIGRAGDLFYGKLLFVLFYDIWFVNV